MNKLQMKEAVKQVAQATGKTEQEIKLLLIKKDQWTWFLLRQEGE